MNKEEEEEEEEKEKEKVFPLFGSAAGTTTLYGDRAGRVSTLHGRRDPRDPDSVAVRGGLFRAGKFLKPDSQETPTPDDPPSP